MAYQERKWMVTRETAKLILYWYPYMMLLVMKHPHDREKNHATHKNISKSGMLHKIADIRK